MLMHFIIAIINPNLIIPHSHLNRILQILICCVFLAQTLSSMSQSHHDCEYKSFQLLSNSLLLSSLWKFSPEFGEGPSCNRRAKLEPISSSLSASISCFIISFTHDCVSKAFFFDSYFIMDLITNGINCDTYFIIHSWIAWILLASLLGCLRSLFVIFSYDCLD